MRKYILFCILLVVLVCCMTGTALAHPGRTDENGGHTDHSTGEYHYHHGYPAHNHWDMDNDGKLDCPYLFDNKTSNNSGNSNGSESTNNDSSNNTREPNSKNDNKNGMPLLEKILGVSVLAGIIGIIAYELFYKK